jgi:hypothetical protein
VFRFNSDDEILWGDDPPVYLTYNLNSSPSHSITKVASIDTDNSTIVSIIRGSPQNQFWFFKMRADGTVAGRDASPFEENRSVQPDRSEILRVYPNPFNRTLHATIRIDRPGFYTFHVVNRLGREMQSWSRLYAAGHHHLQYSPGFTVSSGVYYLTLFHNRQRIDTKPVTYLK